MDLWQLYIFTHVVELGSFSKAAEAVNLSQPTVSSHIKDLEDHLGCRLIDRLGRKASPTKGGDILYSFAKRMLALRDEAQSAMAAYLGEPSGGLSIGGSNIPGCYVLPRIIGAFSKIHPKVSVRLSIGDTRTVSEDVLAGAVELGVVGALSPNKQLVQDKLMEDELRLITPPDHPLAVQGAASLEDLQAHPFILREPGSGTRRFFEKMLKQAGLKVDDLKTASLLGSTEAVREAVKAGLGVSVFSTRAAEGELESGALAALPITGLNLTRSFYLIRHRQRTPSPLGALFADFLKNAASG